MSTTPTPDDAARTLRDFDEHRERATAATGWPTAAWIGGGVLVAVLGVVYDLFPGFAAEWGSWISGVLLLIAVVSTTRWGGALLGRPAHVRRPLTAGRLVLALAFGVFAVLLSFLASRLEVPHLVAVAGVAGGLVLAVAGPWWQRRALSRPPALS